MRRAVFWRACYSEFGVRVRVAMTSGHRPHSHWLGQLTSSLRPDTEGRFAGGRLVKDQFSVSAVGQSPMLPNFGDVAVAARCKAKAANLTIEPVIGSASIRKNFTQPEANSGSSWRLPSRGSRRSLPST